MLLPYNIWIPSSCNLRHVRKMLASTRNGESALHDPDNDLIRSENRSKNFYWKEFVRLSACDNTYEVEGRQEYDVWMVLVREEGICRFGYGFLLVT